MSKDELSEHQKIPEARVLNELRARFSSKGFGLQKREISVMTRMNIDIVAIIDALVELEIFKSRSEAVAAFVEKTISNRRKLFEEIKNQADDIRLKRDAAKHLAYQAMQEEHESTD